MSAAIAWPRGTATAAFMRQVRAHTQLILEGTLLAIDPASGKSSMPGYGLYQKGLLVERGTIEIDSTKPTQERLSELYECIREDFGDAYDIDIVAVERLRGSMVHPTLHWSTGVIVAAAGCKTVIEVPIECWKVLAKVTEGYFKADDRDAALIGEVLVRVASEPETKQIKAPRRRRRKKR